MPTLPESGIVGGVTTGHIAHSQALHKRYNDFNGCHVWVREGATEADIVAALAEVHAIGRGSVNLMGDSYTASGSPAFVVDKPGIDFNLGQAVIDYTGSGICVQFRMDPFTIAKGGTLRGGHIDGTGAAAGAIGVQFGSVISGGIDGTIVSNFQGADSANFEFFNDLIDAYPAFAERNSIRAESRNGTDCYRFRKDAAAGPSFFYNDLDIKFNIDDDETAVNVEAGCQLYDATLRLKGNVDNAGTIFKGAGGIVRPFLDVTIEQTNGTGAVLWGGDESQIVHPRMGRFQVNGVSNAILSTAGGDSYDEGIVVPNWGDTAEVAVIAQHIGDLLVAPYASIGIAFADGIISPYVTVYNGDPGNGFFILARGFGEGLQDAIKVFGVTPSGLVTAAVGIRPGVYTTANRNALSGAVPIGTTVYDDDLGHNVTYAGGSVWNDGSGNPV